MKRVDFEHVLRAAADVVDDELVVIGSQAILAQHPDAPDSLLESMEVDVYPKHDPTRAEEIDGAIGDGSRFHETYDYYAHGVGPETAIAPVGWEERLVRIELPAVGRNKSTVVAWCLEAHDLLLAKLAAGREHDLEYVQEAIRAGLANQDQLALGLELLPASHRQATRKRLTRVLARLAKRD